LALAITSITWNEDTFSILFDTLFVNIKKTFVEILLKDYILNHSAVRHSVQKNKTLRLAAKSDIYARLNFF
tara:strand:+ start:175974 stop:176186 length:213 start_codon:yes stop_codon:yes gene_type:complete